MQKHRLKLTTALVFGLAPVALAAPVSAQTAGAGADSRPNIIVIVADDLGFSDLGAFGGEIRTPNLDALAMQGVRLTQLHTAPVCSMSRAELLTGVDHHRTGLATFGEFLDRNPNQKGQPGYEGHLNARVVTIAERLSEAGYTTIMSGKWHLGHVPAANPANRGFARSFTLLGGGHNHFNPPSAPGAQTAYAQYTLNGKAVTPPPFYSSDYFTDQLIGFLPDRKTDKRPFFAYLAFTAPHYPLHAPAQDVARYAGNYDMGYDELRSRRVARQKQLGLLKADATAHEPSTPVRWKDQPAAERKRLARQMEVYAGMVDRLDQNIGRLMVSLKERGLADNTLIFFMSDNGAEGHQLEKSVVFPDIGKGLLASGDNSLASLGTEKSYFWYDTNWAEAASAPSRLYKSFPSEGGTRPVAFIAGSLVRQSGISSSYVSVRDVVPTIIELARLPKPQFTRGNDPVFVPTGTSLAPLLRDPGAVIHEKVVDNGEMFGRRWSRRDQWKAVYIPAPTGPARWELFDVVADPGETRDLAAEHRDILAELRLQWLEYAYDNGVVVPINAGN